MGSSAAYGLALSKVVSEAFCYYLRVDACSDVTEFANFMEKLIHINPSGCDV